MAIHQTKPLHPNKSHDFRILPVYGSFRYQEILYSTIWLWKGYYLVYGSFRNQQPGRQMPTIVFISPKGGIGKTTSSLTLGTQFAKHGATVTMIDADPNRPLRKWG